MTRWLFRFMFAGLGVAYWIAAGHGVLAFFVCSLGAGFASGLVCSLLEPDA